MSTLMIATSNVTAPTQFLQVKNETYGYRRFGGGAAHPLVLLQHFMGTLDNWDPAVTDALAAGQEVILFDNAGIGRSTGKVPETVQGMAAHALAFLDALGLERADLLGFSLGGMVAQEIAIARPSLVRKMLLVGTAPEGGEEIMRIGKAGVKNNLRFQALIIAKAGEAFLRTNHVESRGRRGFHRTTFTTQSGSGTHIGPRRCKSPDRRLSRVGSLPGRALRSTSQNQPTMPGGERRVRHPDPSQKFLSAERAPAELRAAYLSRLWARFLVSISRVVCQAGRLLPGVRLTVCALLGNQKRRVQ